MVDKKFIITQEKAIAEHLINLGFVLLSQNGGKYILMNNFDVAPMCFDTIDINKVHFTNTLTF